MYKFLKVATLVLGFPILLAEIASVGACNFAGSLCQYAVIGPDERGIIRQNIEALQRNPDQARRIRVDERRFLFGARIDVYADAADGSDLVGSFPISSVRQYEVSRDGEWVVIFTPSARDSVPSDAIIPVDIHLLSNTSGFRKRVFYLECVSRKLPPSFRALNVSFDPKANTLEFDADGRCEHLTAGGSRMIFFKDDYTYSGRLVFEFDADLQLQKADDKPSGPPISTVAFDAETAKANLKAMQNADERADACVAKIRAANTGRPNSPFQYCREEAELENASDYFRFVAIGVDRGRERVVSNNCEPRSIVVADPLRVQVTCVNRLYGADPYTEIDVQASFFGGPEFSFYLYCKCAGFSITEPKYNKSQNAVEFELSSNLTSFKLNSMQIDVEGAANAEDYGPGIPRGKFRVRLSEAGVALGMEPVK